MLYHCHRLLYVDILSPAFPTASNLTDNCHFIHCSIMNVTDIFMLDSLIHKGYNETTYQLKCQYRRINVCCRSGPPAGSPHEAGRSLSISGFYSLGSRASVQQAMSRLVKEGLLVG